MSPFFAPCPLFSLPFFRHDQTVRSLNALAEGLTVTLSMVPFGETAQHLAAGNMEEAWKSALYEGAFA